MPLSSSASQRAATDAAAGRKKAQSGAQPSEIETHRQRTQPKANPSRDPKEKASDQNNMQAGDGQQMTQTPPPKAIGLLGRESLSVTQCKGSQQGPLWTD